MKNTKVGYKMGYIDKIDNSVIVNAFKQLFNSKPGSIV